MSMKRELLKRHFEALCKTYKDVPTSGTYGEQMTAEEIIADERYHTCGRCRWGDLSEELYPCIECNHSFDRRKDYWEYAESDEESDNNDD